MAQRDGIFLKKKFGQHFLRDGTVTDAMLAEVDVTNKAILEIGCGDGFLTKAIVKHDIKKLHIFEIDPEWAAYVRAAVPDPRVIIENVDVLKADFNRLKSEAPWILLANLPYQVTFPILHKLKEHRDLFQEGVIMVQEEVAQKIVKKSGRGYGYPALFFQHYFDWQLLRAIPATAFVPPPKVTSRLLYFKPRIITDPIPDEAQFWQFIRVCFAQPRRMLKNNFAGSQYDVHKIPAQFDGLRAQQMTMADLRQAWDAMRV